MIGLTHTLFGQNGNTGNRMAVEAVFGLSSTTSSSITVSGTGVIYATGDSILYANNTDKKLYSYNINTMSLQASIPYPGSTGTLIDKNIGCVYDGIFYLVKFDASPRSKIVYRYNVKTLAQLPSVTNAKFDGISCVDVNSNGIYVSSGYSTYMQNNEIMLVNKESGVEISSVPRTTAGINPLIRASYNAVFSNALLTPNYQAAVILLPSQQKITHSSTFATKPLLASSYDWFARVSGTKLFYSKSFDNYVQQQATLPYTPISICADDNFLYVADAGNRITVFSVETQSVHKTITTQRTPIDVSVYGANVAILENGAIEVLKSGFDIIGWAPRGGV